MQIIVLTGGLGAGKSTAARYFRERGAAVFCLDTMARDLMSPGSELLARVSSEFGRDVIAADGSLDRAALARAAFMSPQAAERLNAIVHPAVVAEVESLVERLRAADASAPGASAAPVVAVIEVPLLAEAPGIARLGDHIIAIEAPVEMRIARAAARGMRADEARARIAAQATDARRAELADTVIVNDSTEHDYREALDRFWAEHVAGPDRR